MASRFRSELTKIGFWWLTPAWILLGAASGFWLYATVPLFGLAGAWWRASRTRHVEREG